MEKMIEGYIDGRKIEILAGILKGGGIAVLPTDTIYGFHCIASDLKAVDKIRSLKGRGGKAGFILLVSGMSMADSLVSGWSCGIRKKLGRIWPSPLTVILPAGGRVPPGLAPGGKVAVRMPADRDLLKIITRLGCALVSTSVNRSGQTPMCRIGEIRRSFPSLDACISKKGRPPRYPSAIVDLTTNPFSVVREGGFEGRRLITLLKE